MILPFFAGRFPLKFTGLFMFIITAFPTFLLLLSVIKPEIVHARSYNAGLLAALGRRLLNFKLIFDPRSDFLQENIVAQAWAEPALIYKVWLRLEQFIFAKSQHVVLTAPRLIDSKRLERAANMSVIPNCVSEPVNVVLNAPNKKFDFVYCGSVSGWNSLDRYARFIKIMNSIHPVYTYRFMFDEHSYKKLEKSKLSPVMLSDNVTIETHDPCEVGEAISECRYGLYFLNGGADGRLGVKMVEYVSQGVPVIFSSNLISLSDLNSTHCFGLEYDNHTDFEALHKKLEDNVFYNKLCRNAFELSKKFMLSNAINQYNNLYKSV